MEKVWVWKIWKSQPELKNLLFPVSPPETHSQKISNKAVIDFSRVRPGLHTRELWRFFFFFVTNDNATVQREISISIKLSFQSFTKFFQGLETKSKVQPMLVKGTRIFNSKAYHDFTFYEWTIGVKGKGHSGKNKNSWQAHFFGQAFSDQLM